MITRKFSHGAAGGGKSGQAVVEFIVGLVAVLVAVVSIVQLAEIARKHGETMVKARKEAGTLAVQGTGILASPDYIWEWKPGKDERTYSADDEKTAALGDLFKQDIVEKASPDNAGWTALNAAPIKKFQELKDSAKPVDEFGLVKGSDSETVELMSAVQSLLYNSETIKVKTDVWMVWTRGIY